MLPPSIDSKDVWLNADDNGFDVNKLINSGAGLAVGIFQGIIQKNAAQSISDAQNGLQLEALKVQKQLGEEQIQAQKDVAQQTAIYNAAALAKSGGATKSNTGLIIGIVSGVLVLGTIVFIIVKRRHK